MSKLNYKEKLLDPRWQKLRLLTLEKDNFTCQYCGNTEKTLHVHHFCYPKSGNPWDSDLADLITLCSDCHSVNHLKGLSRREKELVSTIQTVGHFNRENELVSYLVKQMNRILLS